MTYRLIWQTSPGLNTEFEREHIESSLFSRIEKDVHYDGRFTIPCDNSIVVISYNKPDPDRTISNYLKSCRNITLLHISGERLYPADWMYRYADVVIKPYFDPRLDRQDVFFVPLGFKSGFHQDFYLPSDCSNRELAWFFAGQLKNHRTEMISTLAELEPHFVHLTENWNGAEGLSIPAMREYFKRAHFAPCPFGWINPDSFRVMEALESGAIPVSIKFLDRDYFRYIYGDHPFLIGSHWREVGRMMRDLIQTPQILVEQHRLTAQWYRDFKEQLALDVKSIIERRFDRIRSHQFAYQLEGRADRSLRRDFNWHFRWDPALAKLKNTVRSIIGQ